MPHFRMRTLSLCAFVSIDDRHVLGSWNPNKKYSVGVAEYLR